MNKIVFVCLLSLSLCFSAPTEEKETGLSDIDKEVFVTIQGSSLSLSLDLNSATTITADHKISPSAPPTTTISTITINQDHTTLPTNTTEASSAIAAPTKDKNTNNTNKKGDATPSNTTSSTSSTIAPVTEKGTSTKPNEEPTKPINTTVAPTTTVATTNASSTTATVDPKPEASTEQSASTIKPTPEPKADKIVQARGFDGASFIGGIVLTVGLLAVGFIGLKYYKNHTERNYHTL